MTDQTETVVIQEVEPSIPLPLIPGSWCKIQLSGYSASADLVCERCQARHPISNRNGEMIDALEFAQIVRAFIGLHQFCKTNTQ